MTDVRNSDNRKAETEQFEQSDTKASYVCQKKQAHIATQENDTLKKEELHMKKRHAALALCTALLLGACGGSGSKAEAQVSTTCTSSNDGVSMTMVLYAPGENKDISSMEVRYSIPLLLFEEKLGYPLDEEKQKEIMENPSSVTGIASGMMGIELSQANVELEEDIIHFTLRFADEDALKNYIFTLTQNGMSADETDLTFKTVKEQMEGGFSGGCN